MVLILVPYSVLHHQLFDRYATSGTMLLFFDLAFLYVLTLNGLSRSLSDLGQLTKPDGSIPHGRWLFIMCGIATIFSGFCSGPPIIISPESAAGIKAGAKTGLSTLVCGILFALSTFFSPIFAAIPAAGTAPLLIMVGVLLFQNSHRIDFHVIGEAVPAYCVLFFIPFTYSILRGVAFGYVTYLLIGLFTGDLIKNAKAMYEFYSPHKMVKEIAKKVEEVPGRMRVLSLETAIQHFKSMGDYKEEDLLDFGNYGPPTAVNESALAETQIQDLTSPESVENGRQDMPRRLSVEGRPEMSRRQSVTVIF